MNGTVNNGTVSAPIFARQAPNEGNDLAGGYDGVPTTNAGGTGGSGAPATDSIYSTTEQTLMDAAAVSNAGTWATEAASINPDTLSILQDLENEAGGGGADEPLGSQASYEDLPVAGSTATTSSSGSAIIFIGLAIVVGAGWFIYEHRKGKKK